MSLRENLNVPVRVVVAQLNCHQAAVIGGKDYLGEPVIDGEILPLDHLIGSGLSHFEHTRNEIRLSYVRWHSQRVKSVLDYAARLDPISLNRLDDNSSTQQPRPVMVIVFPEYSIPFEVLEVIKSWADDFAQEANKDHRQPTVVIFAGTHTLPPRTSANDDFYRKMGFGTFRYDPVTGIATLGTDGVSDLDYAYKARLPSHAVLPMFYHDHMEGRIRSKLKLKRVLSPFELTNTGQHQLDASLLTHDIDTLAVPIQLAPGIPAKAGAACDAMPSLKFLPLVCSEALQSITSADVSFDIAVIPSYHKRPDDFHNVIDHVAHLQRLVLYCNDGRYGGSRFSIPEARRGDGWWLSHPNRGRLPPGDAVIVADVAAMDLAERTAINNPSERCQIQRLAAVVPYGVGNDDYIVAWCLEQLKKRESITVDLSLRKTVLTECLECRTPSNLQKLKLMRLLAFADIDDRVWQLHGTDVVVASPATHETPSLVAMERNFASRCITVIRETQASDSLTSSQNKALAEAISTLTHGSRH